MAAHPLRPATDRRLGRLLPHQLTNQPQAHPRAAPKRFSWVRHSGPNVFGITPCFHGLSPTRRVDHLRVTHPFATLIECKHSTTVRLACLKRAASVRSEPGSNSPSYIITAPKSSYSLTINLFLSSTGQISLLNPLFNPSFPIPVKDHSVPHGHSYSDTLSKTSPCRLLNHPQF